MAHKFRGFQTIMAGRRGDNCSVYAVRSTRQLLAHMEAGRESGMGGEKARLKPSETHLSSPLSKGFTASKAASPGGDKMFRLTSLV